MRLCIIFRAPVDSNGHTPVPPSLVPPSRSPAATDLVVPGVFPAHQRRSILLRPVHQLLRISKVVQLVGPLL